MSEAREPILNVPGAVTWLMLALCGIHGVREWLLTPEADRDLVLALAFIPARYDSTTMLSELLPGGTGADVWTFVTYAFLHADLMHLGVNAIWLLAFGSPVARRFGGLRFLVFFVVTVAAGAFAHLIFHLGEAVPMIGASAAVSGMMGAATRFVFQPGGPLDGWRYDPRSATFVPAAPLHVALRNPRVMTFLAAWFGLNLLFGIGSVSLVGEGQSVAWEAHVGGFLAGLLLFGLFDRANGGLAPD